MTSYICPICGVASNLKPQYNDKNDTTAVSHYFTYCGHKADDNHRLILPLDIEIRGVVEEKTEYRQGDLTGNPVVKYQMRKLVCKQIQDIINGGHFYSKGEWTEWEDIPIITTNSSQR